MIIVKVTYTAKPEFAAQNQENIRKVMSDLRDMDNKGINYNCCLSADGKTFTHTAFFQSEEDRKQLNALPSFIDFQVQLKQAGFEAPPKQDMLTLVGSSVDIF